MPNLREFQITTSQGVTLSCAEQGPAAGAPLLLLHGYSDSWRAYRPLLSALPPSFRTVALTMRGHGDSAKPQSGYAVHDFSADVVAAMDRLGIASAVLVGHSMGSLIARDIAANHPGRVRGLVLIGAFANFRGNASAQAMWDEVLSTMTDPVDPGFVRDFQQSCLAVPIDKSVLDSAIAESCKVPARVWREAFQHMLATDFSAINGIKAPTLLQWGDQDEFASSDDQNQLLAAIPHARLSVFEGIGHAPNWERPERVAAEITAFADQLSVAVAA